MPLRAGLIAHGLSDSMRRHDFGSEGSVTPASAEALADIERRLATYTDNPPRL